jgi:endonuclease YncB( thermonuclease family)
MRIRLKPTLLIATLIVFSFLLEQAKVQENADAWTLRKSYTVKVRKVVDGDTVYIRYRNGIPDELHLLGIDAPGTKGVSTLGYDGYPPTKTGRKQLREVGRTAKVWLKQRIHKGDIVRIRFDPETPTRSSDGPLLGYLIHNGTNLNAALNRDGLASAYRGDYTKMKQLPPSGTESERSRPRIMERFTILASDQKQDGGGILGPGLAVLAPDDRS